MKLHTEIQEFISQINSKISFKEAHSEISREIVSHLEESVVEVGHCTVSGSEAVHIAIKKMGDPTEIGNKLNAIHRDEINWQMIGMTIAIFSIGLFVMSALGKLGAHVTWGFLGLVVGGGLVFVRPATFKRASFAIYFISILMTGLSWKFANLYEGQPYATVGSIKINVVNLFFVPLILGMAGLIDRFRTKRESAVLLLLALVPVVGLVGMNSFYLAAAFSLAVLGMMVAAQIPKWSSMMFSAASIMLIFRSFQSGNFVGGTGLKRVIESEAHTDFVIAYMQLHFPFLFTLALILGAMLILQIAYSAKDIKGQYGRTVFVGGLILFAFSFGFGLLANLGFVAMPASGINIPFLSYGGSMTVGFFTLAGVLISLYRRKSLVRI